MASATIEVLESASLTVGGRTIRKGFPIVTTNPSEIKLWQAQTGVKVTVHEPESPKKKVVISFPLKQKKKKVKIYTYSELNKVFTKEKLVKLAKKLGVFLEGTERKDYMINSIIESQEESE